MTVSNTDIIAGPYTGNGLADTFAYVWTIQSNTEVIVFETTDLGDTTQLILNTDYTVGNVGVEGGGDIVRVAGALPSGYTWYIISNFVATQETDFQSQGAFLPEVHEDAFDKLTYLLQQANDKIDGSFRFSDSYSGNASPILPDPIADTSIVWDATGENLITGPTVLDLQAALDAETAAAASAAAALASEGNASTSETNAATSETNAATSETNAATSETNAATSETNAGNSATAASNAQTAAETAQGLSETAQAASEAAYDSFDDRYLGPKAVAPTLDNDGAALLEGALYWNTVDKEMYVYNGTAWLKIAAASAARVNRTVVNLSASQTLVNVHTFGPDSETVSLQRGTAFYRYIPGTDYNVATNASITLTSGAQAGDVLIFESLESVAGSGIITYNEIAIASQTVFTVPDFVGGYESVYLNGVKLIPTTDYTITSPDTVTLVAGATAGDHFDFMAFDPLSVADISVQVEEAPIDSKQYTRQDASWTEIVPTDISGKVDKTGDTMTGDLELENTSGVPTLSLQTASGTDNYGKIQHLDAEGVERSSIEFLSENGTDDRGAMVFKTKSDVATPAAERLRINGVGDLYIPGAFYVGADGRNDSVLNFYNDTTGVYHFLRFDDSLQEWMIEDSADVNRTLIHSGNIGNFSSVAGDTKGDYDASASTTNSSTWQNFGITRTVEMPADGEIAVFAGLEMALNSGTVTGQVRLVVDGTVRKTWSVSNDEWTFKCYAGSWSASAGSRVVEMEYKAGNSAAGLRTREVAMIAIGIVT